MTMKEMRSLIAALLVFVEAVTIGIIWDMWPTLLLKPTPIKSNIQ
jgi:hypothetical protein